MEQLKFIAKSALAGVMIGIGCTVYLLHSNKTIGVILFSIGLITICELNLPLFTGRCGNILTSSCGIISKTKQLLTIWTGNYAGIVLYVLMMRVALPELHHIATLVVSSKLCQGIPQTLLLSLLCGFLMSVAVHIYNRNIGSSKFIGIVFCVPVFIMCGFEHSIANMFYLSLVDGISVLRGLQYILTVTIGNMIGGIVVPLVCKTKG